MQQYFTRVRKIVRESGWMVQGVLPSKGKPHFVPFYYTVGLTDAGLSELIISWPGTPEMGQDLLNNAARGHVKNEIKPGDMLDFVANVPSRAVAADPHKADIQQAYNYVRDPFQTKNKIRLIQILYPDAEGKFPDEVGYDFAACPQQMWPVQ